MSQANKTVFISYRRTNISWAIAVYQNLTANGFDVFLDVNNIGPGNFENIILNNIASRAHFVLILTPSALERCNEPGDWLRREIEYAIDMNRNVVPLLLEGFSYESPSISQYLTGKLESLREFQSLEVPPLLFRLVMQELRDRYLNIDSKQAIEIHKRSTQATQATQSQQNAIDDEPTVEMKLLSADVLFERGYEHQLMGKYDAALECYTEVIKMRPDYTRSYARRGLIYKQMGDEQAAEQDFLHAIRLKPEDAEGFVGRGDAYVQLALYHEAIRDYTEAIRLNSEYATAYSNRGIAQRQLGRPSAAVQDYAVALRIGTYDDAQIYNNRGLAYTDMGDVDAAIYDFSAAIQHKPDFVMAYYNRAKLYETVRELEAAIADYETILHIDENHKQAQRRLEAVRRKLRRLR